MTDKPTLSEAHQAFNAAVLAAHEFSAPTVDRVSTDQANVDADTAGAPSAMSDGASTQEDDEGVVDLTQDAGEPLPAGCPPMPLDWEPTGITMTLTEGAFAATRTFDTNVHGPEEVNGAYLEMRAEIWRKMWEAKYTPHEMVTDPDTRVVHCDVCHAPVWQVQAGVSCTARTQTPATGS